MELQIPYGNTFLNVNTGDYTQTQVVVPQETEINWESGDLIADALKNPVNSKTITEIITDKKARNAVIVVNDITRPTPYQHILPPLLEEIEKAGIAPQNITLLVALGIHRPHTEAENQKIFGSDICDKYRVVNHDCDNDLVSLGKLKNGMELIINRIAAEADLLITTGLVNLHYFAGYSGGRKSILPGISARSLIEANHQMMSDKRACLGNYQDNPVNDIMIEAAGKAGVDYIINVVAAGKNEIAFAAAGDMYDAWMRCVKYCEKKNVVRINERADIVIASCGGFPKDINMYQAQKALDSASLAVKTGGTIILAAECREGAGEETFAEWMKNAANVDAIFERFNNKFELGGHKAYAICRTLKHADIIMVSALTKEQVEEMFLEHSPSIDTAINSALMRHGKRATVIVMPEASKTGIRIA